MKWLKNFWLFLLRTLQDVTGAVRDSTLYGNVHTNAYVVDARDNGGRVVPVPFSHTVVSGELGGASAGLSDEVNLCVLPANCEVLSMFVSHEAMGATTTAGVTIDSGDSGEPNRYCANSDADLANNNGFIMLFTGLRYRPTVDTIVLLQWGGANPVVGKIIKGFFLIVPGT